MNNKNEIIVFDSENLSVEVRVSPEEKTVWLTQSQMAELFDVQVPAISKHLKKIFEEKELIEEVVISKMETTTIHGAIVGKTQTKETTFYNLDAIISVGYRVRSKSATKFRQWATGILNEYLINGYVANEKRLEQLEKTLEITTKMLASTNELETQEVMKVISEYESALSLLDDYDHQELTKPKGTAKTIELAYKDVKTLIDNMGFNTDVFGVEKEKGNVEGILAAVYQNVFGQEVYPTIEEKAANLLYFMIKDHPYADGCKRIAAAVFLEFLRINNKLYNKYGEKFISNSALVAITLMIAESNPLEKEVMVTLVMNFLVSN